MSNYSKLKTNLKLAIQRLKLLEKKKTELSLKARKEIADFLAIQKVDRARIRVEHIIREDNYVEAMEMLEMFCDLLLARFGLIEKMKELDPGLDEAIATVIWASPRISADVAEFKIIADVLSYKYGKPYAEACKADKINNVNDKVKKRLGLEAPSKLLVEQYLIEIAKNFNINYAGDNSIMLAAGQTSEELIQLREQFEGITKRNNNNNNNDGASGGGGGGGGGNLIHLDSPLFPQETKQVPIGFNEIGETPSWKDLIDLESDINNNQNKSSGSKVPPPLPGELPLGDDHLNGHLSVNNSKNSHENSPPPPFYSISNMMNEANSSGGLNKNLPSAHFNPGDVNAPPLPSKHQLATNNDSLSNDLGRSPPPGYNMPNFFAELPPANTKKVVPTAEDDFDLGLPAVPNTYPDNFVADNNTKSGNDGSASIDYDDLTKRFQNLKNFK